MHASIGQSGEGAYTPVRWILTFQCNDHYRPSNATWVRDLRTFSGYLMGKTRENQQSKASMAQISSLLAVATVFIGLWTLIFTFYS